jgi:predicted RNase H-like nuclease (RuvC/YqgF family)
MKTVWIAGVALAASFAAGAQSTTTIYKHVDENGRITYTNKPMKGAVAMELDPITIIPGTPVPVVHRPAVAKSEPQSDIRPAVATLTVPSKPQVQALAAIEPQVQKRRDEDRRRILEQELVREEESLQAVRASLTQEQTNPTLVAAVRTAQQAADPTPAQMAEMRANIERASGRIRGLQATVAEHEKNIEALKKELGAIKN